MDVRPIRQKQKVASGKWFGLQKDSATGCRDSVIRRRAGHLSPTSPVAGVEIAKVPKPHTRLAAWPRSEQNRSQRWRWASNNGLAGIKLIVLIQIHNKGLASS